VTHTTYGRALAESARRVSPEKLGLRRVFHVAKPEPANPEIPSVRLTGATSIVGAALLGSPKGGKAFSQQSEALIWLWSVLIGLLVVGPLNALVRGGYYSVTGEAIASARADWGEFGPGARRFFPRFWCLYAFYLAVVSLLFWAERLAFRAFGVASLPGSAQFWAYRLVGFLFALAALVMVADGCGVLIGIRRSVATAVRDIVVAAVLAGGIGLLNWGVAYAFGWLRGWAWSLAPTSDLTTIQWSRVGVDLGQALVLAALGTVFVVAALMWYRDSSSRWRQGTAETADEPA